MTKATKEDIERAEKIKRLEEKLAELKAKEKEDCAAYLGTTLIPYQIAWLKMPEAKRLIDRNIDVEGRVKDFGKFAADIEAAFATVRAERDEDVQEVLAAAENLINGSCDLCETKDCERCEPLPFGQLKAVLTKIRKVKLPEEEK